MKYADKQHIAYFLQIESALFDSLSEHTPKGGRATPYSDSGYAVERTELRSTAYLEEPYGVARHPLRSTAILPYGIAHLPVRTATFCQKQSEFQCWFDPSKSRIAPYTIA